MLYPANKLINIISGEDYSQEEIYTIHCTQTNEDFVTITTQNSETKFPRGSFVCGATYHIYIKSITWEGNTTSFIGYGFNK